VSRRERFGGALAVAPAGAAIALLFAGAVLGAVEASVLPIPGEGLSQATLDAWRNVFRDPALGDAIRFSVQTTLMATLISAALAVPAALALRDHGPAVRSIFSAPVPVPYLVISAVATLWLAGGGLLERALGFLPFDVVRDQAGLGIALVYVYHEVPFLTLLILASLGTELSQREEAAAVLGASWRQRLAWVVWPVIRLPMLVGTLGVGAFVFGSFEVPLTVGPTYPETLSTLADDKLSGSAFDGRAQAAALLVLVTAITVAITFALVWLGMRRTRRA